MSSVKRKCEFDMMSKAKRRPAKSTWNQIGLMLYFLINILSIAFLFFSEVKGQIQCHTVNIQLMQTTMQ